MGPSIEPADIGTCKSLKIRCISETSWFDTEQLLADVKAGGGNAQSQYAIAWNSKNSGGYSALVETEDPDGNMHGWNMHSNGRESIRCWKMARSISCIFRMSIWTISGDCPLS